MKNISLIALSLVLSAPAFGSGDHAAPKGSSRFGEGMAVTAFDAAEGFKLSDTAMKSLGVAFSQLDGKAPWKVSKSSLVRIKYTTGVYRRFEGWISFVLVQVKSSENGMAVIQSEDLEPGDEVATAGASFLRLTEADLNADTVDSCSH